MPMIFLIVPKEFLAIKATIEAITTFEGRSTLSATASVLSKISLALPIALLIEKKIITRAIPMIRKIIDHITTKIISVASRTVIVGTSIKYYVSRELQIQIFISLILIPLFYFLI